MIISALKMYPVGLEGHVAVCILITDSPYSWFATVTTTPEQAEAVERIASEAMEAWADVQSSLRFGKRTLTGMFRKDREIVHEAINAMQLVVGDSLSFERKDTSEVISGERIDRHQDA